MFGWSCHGRLGRGLCQPMPRGDVPLPLKSFPDEIGAARCESAATYFTGGTPMHRGRLPVLCPRCCDAGVLQIQCALLIADTANRAISAALSINPLRAAFALPV